MRSKEAVKGVVPKSRELLAALFSKRAKVATEPSLAMKNATEGLKNINTMLMSLVGTPRGSMTVKNNPITDVYKISSTVLGLGINGKVVECFDTAGEKYALKVRINQLYLLISPKFLRGFIFYCFLVQSVTMNPNWTIFRLNP